MVPDKPDSWLFCWPEGRVKSALEDKLFHEKITDDRLSKELAQNLLQTMARLIETVEQHAIILKIVERQFYNRSSLRSL